MMARKSFTRVDPWVRIYQANAELLTPLQGQVWAAKQAAWDAMSPEEQATIKGLVVQGIVAGGNVHGWADMIRKLEGLEPLEINA